MTGVLFAWRTLIQHEAITIDYVAAAVMAVSMIILGIQVGLGTAYAYRPDDKTGPRLIWIVAIGTMTVVGYLLYVFVPDLISIRGHFEAAAVAAIWVIFLLLLAGVGLSQRHQVIKGLRTESHREG